MKIGHLFRSRRECKDPVRRSTKAKARPAPLCVETLEDRTVPSAFPSFPFPTPTLPAAASLNAGANGSLNSNSLMSSLGNLAIFDLAALSSTLAAETTLLSSFAASNLPGGLSAPFLGSNTTLLLDSLFVLLSQQQGSLAGGIPSTLGGSLGSGLGLLPGNI